MSHNSKLHSLVVSPADGRMYSMGRMSAIFKADLDETDSALSVSEWWLDPKTEGPHIHKHPEAHLFNIIDGTLSVFLDGRGWVAAEKGSYIYIPGGIDHGFENRSDRKVGFMSINTPGGFEKSMPEIVKYFENAPLGDSKH